MNTAEAGLKGIGLVIDLVIDRRIALICDREFNGTRFRTAKHLHRVEDPMIPVPPNPRRVLVGRETDGL